MKLDRRGRLAPEPVNADAPRVTYPIPAIVRSAFALAQAQYQIQLNALAREAVQAVGVDPDAYTYNIDLDAGVIVQGEKRAPAPPTP